MVLLFLSLSLGLNSKEGFFLSLFYIINDIFYLIDEYSLFSPLSNLFTRILHDDSQYEVLLLNNQRFVFPPTSLIII
jgi:hypothetical protein